MSFMYMDASKWRFRGEGNASLVLVNAEEKRVYRFPKYTHWGKGHLIASDKTKSERVHEELQLVVDYMSNVMQPLLSPSFVVLPELLLIPAGLTEEAETQIQVSRPAQRKGKEVEAITIDSSTMSALVLPDLCYVRDNQSNSPAPTLSIEIKPKKAFMHSRDSQSDVTDEQLQVCKFCMHQRLKAKEGQWPNTSQYCPLDLFSGDRTQMKQALLALAKTPQNNLRICQNGEEIHGAWNKEDLSEVFENFFGHWPNGLTNGLWKQQALHTFLDLVLEALLFVPTDNRSESALLNHVQCSTEELTSTSNYAPCSCEHMTNRSSVNHSQYFNEPPMDNHVQCSVEAVTVSQNSHFQCCSEKPKNTSQKNHVQCRHSGVQLVMSKPSQYCQNSVAQRTLDDPGHDGYSSTLKEPMKSSSCCYTSIADSQITSGYHSYSGVQVLPELSYTPGHCCHHISSRLSVESGKFSDCQLPPGCVLERVLMAQKLDSLDIHGIFPLYQQINRHLQQNPDKRSEFCLDGPYTKAGWLCQCTGEAVNCQSAIEDTYMQDIAQKVKRFLVSKTVQDCSVMVALQALAEGEKELSLPCICDPYGGRYRFSVSIIDLDPKPFCKIPTYHEQDREIVEAYKEACSMLDSKTN